MTAYIFRVLTATITVCVLLLSNPAVAVLCDFDGDGGCFAVDIDALSEQVILGQPDFDPQFDLTADGQLDLADRDEWLSLAAIENGFGSPYFLGDANLDGRVNASDLMLLGLNWQSNADRWSHADFTMDGKVNAADLNALAINWQKQNPSATAAVPEPMSLLLLLLGATLVHRLAWVHRRGLLLVVIVACLPLSSFFTSITRARDQLAAIRQGMEPGRFCARRYSQCVGLDESRDQLAGGDSACRGSRPGTDELSLAARRGAGRVSISSPPSMSGHCRLRGVPHKRSIGLGYLVAFALMHANLSRAFHGQRKSTHV